MAKQAGMRREREKDRAPVSLNVDDVIARSPLSLAAKRLLRATIRGLTADVKSIQARHVIAQAAIKEGEAQRAHLTAELDRLREIHAATQASLIEAGASRAAILAANAELQRALDDARALRDDALGEASRLREGLIGRRAEGPTLPSEPCAQGEAPAATFAPAEPFRRRAAPETPRRVAAEQPAPLRPTPRAPENAQAAAGRGRVNVATAVGELLLRAPPTPGGHAGRCFAELLDRAAGRLTAPSLADEDESAGGAFEGRRDWSAKDDLGALAALYRLEASFYRDVAVRPSDSLPLNGDVMRSSLTPQRGSSPAAACVEAAHG